MRADLAILVPMLGRADRVPALLESIEASTPDARVLFLTTPSDVEVRDTLDRLGAERLDVPWSDCGDYARKVNTGFAHTTEPLVFTGAIDLRFHPGWFEACQSRLRAAIGVVGTNDQCNKRTKWGHSTHSLVTRDYVERFGTIDEPGKVLHEGYVHEYVDDELVATAKKRRAYAHAPRAIVEHLHPMNGRVPVDALYDQQAARMEASRQLYRSRRRLWT